jgi:glycosyltransferase involved in cell wall biosynthesis
MKKDIIIFSTADWANPFWTNKQHVAVEMAKLGDRVFYIDSIGLRRPSVSTQDAKRIWRRIKRAFQRPVEVRPNLWVWSPLALPFPDNAVARQLTSWWLQGWLAFFLQRLGFRRDILWTYNPLTTRLLNLRRFKKVVYHCVDAIEAQPGMPTELLKEAEKELVTRADVVFTTSPALAASRGEWNPHTHYFSNVADYEHFARAMTDEVDIPPDLAAIPAPRLGFVGAISGYKLDFELIRAVALSRPEWSVVLIGKVGEGDPWTRIDLLTNLPNVHLLGPRDYQDLPAYLKGIDVAIQPNSLNEYTNSMFPMKFFEYLAAGKPVVSVDLAALRSFAPAVRIAETYADFIEGVDEALRGQCLKLADRLAVAREHTYSTRMKKMQDIVDATNGSG